MNNTTILTHDILFNRPVKAVFDFVTTMGHWPQWHPATLAVSGDTKRPSRRGDEVTETLKTAGLKGKIRWVVRESRPPNRWVLESKSIGIPFMGKAKARIFYTFTPAGKNRTRFRRKLSYVMPSFLHRIFDLIYFRRQMESESRTALARLKKLVEAI